MSNQPVLTGGVEKKWINNLSAECGCVKNMYVAGMLMQNADH